MSPFLAPWLITLAQLNQDLGILAPFGPEAPAKSQVFTGNSQRGEQIKNISMPTDSEVHHDCNHHIMSADSLAENDLELTQKFPPPFLPTGQEQ